MGTLQTVWNIRFVEEEMCHNTVVMAVCAFCTSVVCLFLVVIIAMSSPGSVLLVFFYICLPLSQTE